MDCLVTDSAIHTACLPACMPACLPAALAGLFFKRSDPAIKTVSLAAMLPEIHRQRHGAVPTAVTALHRARVRCTALHSGSLHRARARCTALHSGSLHCTTVGRCTALPWVAALHWWRRTQPPPLTQTLCATHTCRAMGAAVVPTTGCPTCRSQVPCIVPAIQRPSPFVFAAGGGPRRIVPLTLHCADEGLLRVCCSQSSAASR